MVEQSEMGRVNDFQFCYLQATLQAFVWFRSKCEALCTTSVAPRYSAKRTLDYFEGNFDAFRKARRISSDEEAEAILLGRHNFDNDVDPEEGGGGCPWR